MDRRFYQDPRYEELIPVVYARNTTEAELYRSLLEDQDITVVIEKNQDSGTPGKILEAGVPVLVPEEHLAEAQDIIEQHNAMADEIEAEFEEYRGEDEGYIEYDQVAEGFVEADKPENIDEEDNL
ncbi:MAG: hypothetical protein AMJ79_15625 [Phycisphaerae bacterium SM23_30]|nr:MAG: hypothetical protein AMJ79_15625 [Phycisphaerae bacterium SM23_30]